MDFVWSPSLMTPTPTRTGTSAFGLPSSKCARNSAEGSMSSVRHSPTGPPDSTTTVSCATNRLRFRSQVRPFSLSELHAYLSEYHLSPRFQETYTTAAESPRPSLHSLPPLGRTCARHFQRTRLVRWRSASGTSAPSVTVSSGGR